jgi:WD40 repeat protein
MLVPFGLALLAVFAPAAPEENATGDASGNRLFLWSYDRLAIIDLAEPAQLVNEWNLGDSVRDISGVASSKSILLFGYPPDEHLPCLYALSRLDSAVERVACGRILAISVADESETAFLLERQERDPNITQVMAVDLQAKPQRVAFHCRVELAASSLSVANQGERIVLGSGGFLLDFDRRSGNLVRLTEGTSPSLSPDGSRLAFLQDGSLYIYDFKKRTVQRILNRRFWQSRLVGPVSWSPTGELLSVSAPTGIAGKRLRCLIVSESGEVATSFESGAKWCGPWE